jgi:hypothetical protein
MKGRQDLYYENSTIYVCSGPSLRALPLELYLFRAAIERNRVFRDNVHEWEDEFSLRIASSVHYTLFYNQTNIRKRNNQSLIK